MTGKEGNLQQRAGGRSLGREQDPGRDIVDWRGQRRRFYQRAHEVDALPPIAVIWGERDRVIPVKHAEALTEFVEGLQVTILEGCGHYLHHEKPQSFARVVRDFLDAPVAAAARLRG